MSQLQNELDQTPFEYKKLRWLSITSLVEFSRCPRKFFFNKRLRLGQEGFKAPAPTFGTALHEAIPMVIKGSSIIDGMLKVKELFPEELQTPDKNYDIALKLLSQTADLFNSSTPPFDLLDPPENAISIPGRSPYEVAFAVDIGLSIPLVGFIDGRVKQHVTKSIGPLEIKTASRTGNQLFESFQFNPQLICYAFVMSLLTKEPVDLAMTMVLRTTKNPIISIDPIYIDPDSYYDSFIEWARYQGGQILEMEKRMIFPKNIAACSTYPQFGMGSYQCYYKTLCQSQNWPDVAGHLSQGEEHPFALLDPNDTLKYKD
jgi:hypothetical protein